MGERSCDPPRNVKMPELFTLRHFSHQFLLYFRLQNRSPALHQPYRQYNFLGNRLILQAFRNILHTQFCHFLHRLMDRRDLGCCNRRYHHVVEADQLDILRHPFAHLCADLDHLRSDQITAGKNSIHIRELLQCPADKVFIMHRAVQQSVAH